MSTGRFIAVASSCGSVLAAFATCSLGFRFHPTTVGPHELRSAVTVGVGRWAAPHLPRRVPGPRRPRRPCARRQPDRARLRPGRDRGAVGAADHHRHQHVGDDRRTSSRSPSTPPLRPPVRVPGTARPGAHRARSTSSRGRGARAPGRPVRAEPAPFRRPGAPGPARPLGDGDGRRAPSPGRPRLGRLRPAAGRSDAGDPHRHGHQHGDGPGPGAHRGPAGALAPARPHRDVLRRNAGRGRLLRRELRTF